MSRLFPLLGLVFLVLGLAPLACSDDAPDPGQTIDGSCSDASDCSEGLICSALGTCIECQGDGDCGRAQRCDAASFACIYRDGWGDECVANVDCPLSMFCVQGLCTPGEGVIHCGALGQCPAPTATDPTTRRCNRALQVCEEDLGCFGDGDCLEAEVCNPGTGACEQRCTAETEADICQVRERCSGGRCVECLEESDCGPGLVCNVAAGRCSGPKTCFTDRECGTGTICNRGTKTCTKPPPPCDANDDCLEDERCDLQLGRCLLAACQPDMDEPNEDQASATRITAGNREGLTLCGGDEDWYRIALRRGDRVNINIQADVLVAGGLDALLRDAAGRELARDPFLLDAVATQDADYFIRIRTRDEQARYALHIIIVRGVPCDDDQLEENDDFTLASMLPAGERRNLQACPGDPDWYVVEVAGGRGLSVSLTHDPLRGDLDLFLFGSDGTTQLASSRTTDPVEKVQVAGVSGGRAYLLVLSADDRTRNAYDLAITVQ